MATTEQAPAVQLSLPLPKSLDTRIYLRLSTETKAIVLSLTTAAPDEPASAAPMGSFVYGIPNVYSLTPQLAILLTMYQRFNTSQPLATTLFPHEPTLEFTTRLAKLIARKTELPVYVTNSISFRNAGMGGTVEEEMEAFKNIAEIVLAKIKEAGIGATAVNSN